MIRSRRSRAVAAAALLLTLASGSVAAQGPGNTRAYEPRSGGIEVTRHDQTGLVRAMSGTVARPVARASARTRGLSAQAAARAFVTGEVGAFGIADPAQLALVSTRRSAALTTVKLQQTVEGVPVLGAQLNVQLDRGRNVVSVIGETVATSRLPSRPAVNADQASAVALAATAGRYRLDRATLHGSRPSLAIHDTRIFGGRPRPNAELVWRVDVTAGASDPVHEIVLVDASTGRVALQFSQIAHAAPANATQRVCNANNTASKVPCSAAQAVPNPGSSTVADVKNAFKFAENTYDFFARRFNRNSINGAGMVIISTVKYCDPSQPCPYQNAFWTPQYNQMVYGQGFSVADDVVGHELTHGVTSFESNLFYFYQSGAINESLSDIFGELMDLTNPGANAPANRWLLGEEIPGFGAIRDMENPPAFGHPDRMGSPNYTADQFGQDSGGVHTNSGVGNKAAFLMTEPGTRSFNGKNVSGIGIDKSAAIWNRVNNMKLTTSSDYQDLHVALRQACADLVGTTPKNAAGNPSASGPITGANCQEVKDAADATEMHLQQAANKWPIPFEAPKCAPGKVPNYTLNETFAGPKSGWDFALAPGGQWVSENFYAEGNNAAMVYETGANTAFDKSMTQKAGVVIPNGGFLRFDHYYQLYGPSGAESGGVVEYQVGAGPWQRVTPAMFTHNPYNDPSISSGTVLNGDPAFTWFSGGWTSSRINLAALAGQNVKFRFRAVAGSQGAYDAWIIDNAQVYRCV